MKVSEIRQAAGERCEGWGLGQKLRAGYRDEGGLLRRGEPVRTSGNRWSDSSSHLPIIRVVSPGRAIH